jgi:hypothetical protein
MKNNPKNDRALGARIKVAMKAVGFKTAKEFCEKHNIPYLTFAQHTQGRRHPSQDFLALYSKVFGVNTHWLETGTGNPLATSKKPTKSAKIIKLSSKEIDKRLQIDQLTYKALDTTILAEIFKCLFLDKFSIKPKEAESMAKAAAFIYNDIVTLPEEQNTKIKMVQAAVRTFLRQIK